MRYIHCWSSVKSLIQESRECAHLQSSLGSNSMIHPSVLFIWVFRAASLECAGRGAMFNGSKNLRYSKKVVVASSSNPSTSNSHYFIHLQGSEGADFGRGLWTPNLVYNLVSAEVVLVSFKITKRTMRPDMSYIRCWQALLFIQFPIFVKVH